MQEVHFGAYTVNLEHHFSDKAYGTLQTIFPIKFMKEKERREGNEKNHPTIHSYGKHSY